MNKYIPVIIVLVVIIAVLGGLLAYRASLTTATSSPTTATGQELTIYMVTHGAPTDPFWIPVIEGAEYAAALLHVKVIYEAPSTFSISAMTQLLSEAIAAHPNGLIISVPSPSAEIPLINEAYEEGIPVLIVNAIPTPSSYPGFPFNETIAYVGQNDYQAGYALGEFMVKWYEQTHNGQKPTYIVIFNHEPGLFSLTERIAGIEAGLNASGDANAEVTVVPISLNYAQSESIIASYLESHPNVQIIVTLGPAGTDPAVAALNETGLAGKVALFSFDYDNITLNAIKEGIDIATVDQQPMEQGFLSVVVMFMYLKLGIVPAEYNISTGPFIVTKSTLKFVEKQNAMTQVLSSYLKVGADPNGVYIIPLTNITPEQLLSMVSVEVVHHKGYYEIIISPVNSSGETGKFLSPRHVWHK